MLYCTAGLVSGCLYSTSEWWSSSSPTSPPSSAVWLVWRRSPPLERSDIINTDISLWHVKIPPIIDYCRACPLPSPHITDSYPEIIWILELSLSLECWTLFKGRGDGDYFGHLRLFSDRSVRHQDIRYQWSHCWQLHRKRGGCQCYRCLPWSGLAMARGLTLLALCRPEARFQTIFLNNSHPSVLASMFRPLISPCSYWATQSAPWQHLVSSLSGGKCPCSEMPSWEEANLWNMFPLPSWWASGFSLSWWHH